MLRRGASLMVLLCALLALRTAAAQDSGGGISVQEAPQLPSPEVLAKLHEVRPPVSFDPPLRIIDYILLASGALVLLGLLIAAMAARREVQPEPDVPSAPPAYLQTLEALEELGARGYFNAGEDGHQALAEALPPILKHYLLQATSVWADPLTTRETAKALRDRELEWLSRQLGVLLAACDRVKFGGASLFAEDPIPLAKSAIRVWAEREGARGGGV